jgi:hypothetical protein
MVVPTWRRRRTSGRAVAGPSLPRSVLSSAVLLFALAPLGAGLAAANESGATRVSARGDHEPKAVYVDRANHICAAASQLVNDVLDAAYADTARSDAQPAEREEAVVDQVAPIIRGEITALRHLPAPKGDEAPVKAIYDEMEGALATVEHDPSTFRFYGQGTTEDPFSGPAELAAAYGLDVCALGSPDAD